MSSIYAMLDLKNFSSVIHDLENGNGEFIAILDRLIKFVVNKFKNIEELREEIIDYDDVFQINLTGINFNFWLKISNSTIIYKKGINRSASFKVEYPKDIMIKVLKREMYGTDAFMKGIIKVDGDLSQGLRFIKLFRMFMKYLHNGFSKLK